LEIEALYSSTMEGLQREWDTPEVREKILEELREVEDLDIFYKILDKIEICFSDPYQVTYKKIETEAEREALLNPPHLANEDAEMKDEALPDKNTQEVAQEAIKAKLTEVKGDMLVKRKKIMLFKFWPKNVQRSSWKKYIYAGEAEGNLNVAHLAVQVLDRVGEQFALNCIKKLDRKTAKLGAQVGQNAAAAGPKSGG
jgi:hypothetical protein